MKKTILGLTLILALLLVLIYVLIPSDLSVREKVIVNAPLDALFRKLQHPDQWTQWWPEADTSLTWEDKNFHIDKIMVNRFELTGQFRKAQVESLLTLDLADSNRTEITWTTPMKADWNPVTRVRQYFLQRECQDTYHNLLDKLKQHYDKVENVYGFPIAIEQVPFRFATAWKRAMAKEPTIHDIYLMIDSVKGYIQRTGGAISGDPMFHSTPLDPFGYEVQVAIPTETKLPEAGPFSSKWFLKGGLILATDVNGGPGTIQEAMRQVDLFVSDHHRGRVAIPFQGLITDRRKEADTSRWKSRVYFPII